VSLGAAILLIFAFGLGIVVPRVQLVLPVLIAVVLVSGHASWHLAERAHRRLDRRVVAALVIGYLGLAVLVGFTEYFIARALASQAVQRP
jgi:hypothetical protein